MQVHQSHQFQDQDRTDLLSIRSAQRRIDLLHEVGSIHSGKEYIFKGIVYHFDTFHLVYMFSQYIKRTMELCALKHANSRNQIYDILKHENI